MIKSGTTELAAGTSAGWNLSAGFGDRSYMSPDIQFGPADGPPPFSSPPTVVVSLAGIEQAGGTSRLNVSVSAENVQAEEFNIRVSVSEDCWLKRVWVTWLASDGT